MPNMNSYTDINNHKGIDNCKYHNKNTCPLPNSFQTTGVIYQANIDCDIGGYKQKCYLDSRETTFKYRLGNHKKLFNLVKHKNNREPPKEFWEIKKLNGTPKITYKIIRKCRSYKPNSKCCLFIFTWEIRNDISNKKTEIINTCRHRRTYNLANCETIGCRQIHAIRCHYNAPFIYIHIKLEFKSWVQIPLRPTLSFSGECHMYRSFLYTHVVT